MSDLSGDKRTGKGRDRVWELVSQSKECLAFKQHTSKLRRLVLKNTQLLILLCSPPLST